MIVFDWALDVRGVALRQLSKQAGRWSICRVRCGGIDDHRRWPPTLQLRSGWCVWDSRRLGNMSGPYAAPRDAPCRKHGGPGRAAAGPSRRRRRCQRSQRRSASPTSCTTLGVQARVDERLRPPTKGAGACRGWSEGRRRGGWRFYSVRPPHVPSGFHLLDPMMLKVGATARRSHQSGHCQVKLNTLYYIRFIIGSRR